jgi:hypothetical protein
MPGGESRTVGCTDLGDGPCIYSSVSPLILKFNIGGWSPQVSASKFVLIFRWVKHAEF